MTNKLKSKLYNTNILSWNIQASNTVSGSKFDDADFCEILLKHKIICLQETRQSIKFPGFRSFNNVRSDEKNGGVCILVKNEISNGIMKINTAIPDTVVCKLKQSFFNLTTEIFLINV